MEAWHRQASGPPVALHPELRPATVPTTVAVTMMVIATSMMIVASTCTCGGRAMRAESNTRRGKVIVGPATNDVMM